MDTQQDKHQDRTEVDIEKEKKKSVTDDSKVYDDLWYNEEMFASK